MITKESHPGKYAHIYATANKKTCIEELVMGKSIGWNGLSRSGTSGTVPPTIHKSQASTMNPERNALSKVVFCIFLTIGLGIYIANRLSRGTFM